MLDRRSFFKTAGLAVAAASAVPLDAQKASANALIKPKALKNGDTVGMVLPASMSFEADNIERAKENLEAVGFKVKLGRNAYARNGYLAGTDRQRADDINAMFADSAIDGIFAFTGGWGTPRLLPYLDYELIRKNPKVLSGFSDITGLLNAIHRKTGLVTFHGPNGDSRWEPYTMESFRRSAMRAEPVGLLPAPPRKGDEAIDRENRIVTLGKGTGTGRLVGGNLTLVAATIGTPYEIETNGAILFLEDTHEELYRIDRMLTQLWLAGKFEKLAGFAFGRCTDCPATGPSLSMGEILRERFSHVPSVWGLSFGHIEKKLTLPIGVNATLDADARTLTINEAAVI